MKKHKAFAVIPIGYIRRGNRNMTPRFEILEPYIPALKQLEHFSHVICFWWADQHDNDESRSILQTRPPYAQEKVTGVFATRAEYRPNPIGMTTCRIVDVNHEKGVVHVADIDAYDGTPIVDLKAYFPVCDRVKDARIPEWLASWPEWMPEEGLGLE